MDAKIKEPKLPVEHVSVYLEVVRQSFTLLWVADENIVQRVPKREVQQVPNSGFMELEMFIVHEDVALRKGWL